MTKRQRGRKRAQRIAHANGQSRNMKHRKRDYSGTRGFVVVSTFGPRWTYGDGPAVRL